MKLAKKIMAGLLTVAILLSSIILTPNNAEAAESETLENGVMYELDETKYKFTDYWKPTESERKAPVKPGFVFGGWYQKVDNTYAPLKEAELTAEGAEEVTTAYAKFVPDYVLSIKAQNEEGTKKDDGNSSVRVISSVDSRQYQNVGFQILLNNKKDIGTCESTDVYKAIKSLGDNVTAATTFGSASSHFSVWRLDSINDANDSKIIYARPYWTTLDGTKVEGLAKYVHIEDEYNDYISVPINVMTGEAVAAGALDMTYASDVLTVVSVEAGRVLKEMNDNRTTAGTINMIGNATVTTDGTLEETTADGIYANVRFKVNTNKNIENANLEVIMGEFYNWSEQPVNTVQAWNLVY